MEDENQESAPAVGLTSTQQFAGFSENRNPPVDEFGNHCVEFDCVEVASGGIIQCCSPEFKVFNDCP